MKTALTAAAASVANHDTPHRDGVHEDTSPHTVVTNRVVRRSTAVPGCAAVAFDRLDLLRPLANALSALALRRFVSLQRIDSPDNDGALGTVCLVWPLRDDERAHVAWTVSVTADDDSGTWVSIAVRVGTDHRAAGPRLLDAWSLLGPLVDSQTRHMITSIVDLAEQLEDETVDV